MKAFYPLNDAPLPPLTREGDASAREQALEQQIQALREENALLRESYAASLAQISLRGQTPPLPDSLPLRLHSALDELSATPATAAARLEYEALFNALAHVFPIGIFRIDHAGVLTHVDDRLLQLFGLTRQDFPNFGWLSRVHPDDLEQVQQHWVQGVSLGQALNIEFRLARPNQPIGHVLVRNVPQHDASGNITSQLGFVQDITLLRTLEADARLKEDLNRQIIASSPDCTKVLDLQGRVLQMTAKGCELVEVDDFEQVRLSDWTQWWPEDNEPLAAAAVAAAARGQSARFLASAHTFKGTPKWWDTVVSPICDAQGQPVMLLAVSRDITESRQQQEEIYTLNVQLETRVQLRTQELANANQRIGEALNDAQTLYNQAPCGYHSLNLDGVYVSINDTELAWLGYSREEVVHRKRFADVISPKHHHLLETRMQDILQDRATEGAEYEMRRRDGSIFYALLSSTAVRDAQGRFLRSNTTVVNITHRKQAEMALHDNQRFLRAITEQVPGLIAYLDAMLRFRFANAQHLRVYGMDPQHIMGLHISECLPPDVWAETAPRMRAALGGQKQQFEAWRRTVDGTPIFINATYQPDIHDGLVQGVFVQIIDITERKRVEERISQLNDELERRIQERSAELLESDQRFRLMVDNLREYGIFFMGPDGRITDWTDSAQRLEGYPPTEMLGRHYAVLFNQSNPEKALDKANQALRLAASRGQHELSDWHTRKDGSQYWSHSLLIALRDGSGELRGFAKINRDMSDAKRLDDLMRNINDELENRVAERTEQLLAANKDLESFSYSVSHDLRSPLRHISSFVSLLEEHLGAQYDDVSARYLGTIGSSARHMSQLIDGLLAFSRLGRSAVNVAPVDFALLVGDVVSQLAHDTEGRVVDWLVAPDLPLVQGDALLLREVWANLLGNAYKYTRPRARAHIEIGWSVDPAVGYTFFVRDNGVGFDSKYAGKLFGVFQRLHRASEFEGTGIGLALTRRIVERHGGSIWAESQLGEGSVFYFSLPFESVQASDDTRDSMYAALEP